MRPHQVYTLPQPCTICALLPSILLVLLFQNYCLAENTTQLLLERANCLDAPEQGQMLNTQTTLRFDR
jgi:hypothetical protein